MPLAKVYPLLVAKAERKGRSESEVRQIVQWLTGYTPVGYISLARFVFDRLSIQRFIAEDDKLLNRSRVVPMKRSKWFTASL
ncbi:DUF2200 family protein [Bacteroides mediterraneensis]|nr:DUF2200 family protein [Bacteroides mediterraneensis]